MSNFEQPGDYLAGVTSPACYTLAIVLDESENLRCTKAVELVKLEKGTYYLLGDSQPVDLFYVSSIEHQIVNKSHNVHIQKFARNLTYKCKCQLDLEPISRGYTYVAKYLSSISFIFSFIFLCIANTLVDYKSKWLSGYALPYKCMQTQVIYRISKATLKQNSSNTQDSQATFKQQ